MRLYRPVGPDELALVYEAQMRAFPPRLPEQPIFYPVLNEGYARQIAREWNAPSAKGAGFATRFEVDDAYASRFERRVVGGREHEELWVPVEELGEFNGQIDGSIEIVAAYFGEPFVGRVAERGALAGEGAAGQLAALAAIGEGAEFDREVDENHLAVFLNYFYWESPDARIEGLSGEGRERALARVRASWARSAVTGARWGELGVRKGA
jgi:hypothetical protein